MHDRGAEDLRTPGEQVVRRSRRSVAAVLTLANLAGAVGVFLFLNVAVPSTAERASATLHFDAVLAVLFAYLLVAGLVSRLRLERLARPVEAWLLAGRPPDEREQVAALRLPARIGAVAAAGWAGAVVVMGATEATEDLHAAVDAAIAIALGGLTSTALTTLLVERALRPVTARALAAGPPARAAGPTVRGRLLLAWVLGTGAPLAGLAAGTTVAFAGEYRDVESFAVAVVMLVAACVVAGLACIWIAARHVGERVSGVRHAMEALQGGDLGARVAADDGGEVGLLQAGFNQMAAGLEERERLRDLFGRHVGEEVAREALERGVDLGGETRDVAALFVDLVGSTTLASEVPPAEVVALLNRFFAEVVDVVGDEGGWVNKFEGDAALCVFGAPQDREDPAGDALAAARRLAERLRERVPEVDLGIGVSAGPAVAGNIGADRRLEYTVIGDAVNEAARLCDLAKSRPSRVLASEAAVRAAREEEAARWSLGESVTLRGRTAPTGLAEPARSRSASAAG